jgi:TRAP-type C4-dicarboxylate transport system substrate-binding protein
MNIWYKKLIYIKITLIMKETMKETMKNEMKEVIKEAMKEVMKEMMKEVMEYEEQKKTYEQNKNIKSFISAALGALIFNILYNYFNF